MSGGDLLADVLRGGDGDEFAVGTVAIRRGLAAQVGASAVGALGDGFGPGEEVCGLLGQQAAAFFLVEEDHGLVRKSLAACGGDGGGGVLLTELRGAQIGALDLLVELAVAEDEKAETGVAQDHALAEPGVFPLARGVVEPVAREGEVLVQRGETIVAGIEVAIEACEAGLDGWVRAAIAAAGGEERGGEQQGGEEDSHCTYLLPRGGLRQACVLRFIG